MKRNIFHLSTHTRIDELVKYLSSSMVQNTTVANCATGTSRVQVTNRQPCSAQTLGHDELGDRSANAEEEADINEE